MLHLPPGLVGNPNAAAKCAGATFEAGSAACPNAQVGRGGRARPAPATSTTSRRTPGEPARLGISILRPDQEPGVGQPAPRRRAGLHDRRRSTTGGLELTALDLTLDSDFMTLPTSCPPATVTIDADSAAFTPTGCENVPFTPSCRRRWRRPAAGRPSGATVDAHAPRATVARAPRGDRAAGGHDALAGRRERPGGLHRRAVRAARAARPASQVGDRELRHAAAGRRSAARSSSATASGSTWSSHGHGRAGQARRRRQARPGHGPDHDDLRQPAAGPVHDVRADASTAARTPCWPTRRRAATKQLAATADALERHRAEDRDARRFTIDQGCALPAFAPAALKVPRRSHRRRPPGRRGDDRGHAAPTATQDLTQRHGRTCRPGLAGSLKGVPVCPTRTPTRAPARRLARRLRQRRSPAPATRPSR